jgi:MFS transporter, Spinster family, sphingosine-1-phosphate transporter
MTYVMGLLLLINVLNFIDRQIPFILAQSIKRDLHLSDGEIGLLGGLAFSLIYPIMGIPLARAADRFGPKWILAGSLLLWSSLTALGSLVTNFGQLFAARLGVAAGEAGSTPTAHALIASYYPLERRGMPLAVFSLGVPLGSMLALMAGGWLNDVASWRQALFWLGIPGVLLAIAATLTLREPKATRGILERTTAEDIPLWGVIKLLMGKRAFRQMALGIGVYSMGANAMIVFTPSFLMRTHALSATAAGLWLGLMYGIFGVAGTLAGGSLSDKLGKTDGRWRLWAPALGLALAAPCTLAAWLVPNTPLSLSLLAAPKFANLLYIAPIFAALQTLVPATARASASALLLFFNSSIGLAFGPPIVGGLSDWLARSYGPDSLRYALCLVPITQIWAAMHFAVAAKSLEKELDVSAEPT